MADRRPAELDGAALRAIIVQHAQPAVSAALIVKAAALGTRGELVGALQIAGTKVKV